jgi:hypothetical protein
VRTARALSLAVTAVALGGGCGAPVDLNAVPEAKARCESATPDLRLPGARMLPGRRCLGCHLPGGQAGERLWTAAGTVYDRPDSPCNTGGLEGVSVDLLDGQDRVLITLTTNRSGNFFTAEPLGFQRIRARLRKDGRVREMQTHQTTADCAGCHFPGGPAPGRLFLD